MKDNKELKVFSVTSDKELARRWEALRAMMSKNGLDCLLFYGSDLWSGGLVRYVTDFAPDNAHGYTVLFPAKGGMGVYSYGELGGKAIPDASNRGNIDVNFSYPCVPSLSYMDDVIGKKLVEFVQEREIKVLGITRLNLVPYYYIDYLRSNVEGLKIVCVDDQVDEVITVKSEEELKNLDRAHEIHDQVYLEIYENKLLHAGMYEWQLRDIARKRMNELGVEYTNTMIGADPVRPYHRPMGSQTKMIENGDYVEFLIESACGGGYYAEIGRTWVVGKKPSVEFVRCVEGSIEAQHMLADIARPGVRASEMRRALMEYQEANGFDKVGRLPGHGQGLDLVQRPGYIYSETFTFRENMVVSIHPDCGNQFGYANVYDNYLITKDGPAKRLFKLDQHLFVV